MLLFNKLHGMTHEQLSTSLPRETTFRIPTGEGWSKRDRITAAIGNTSQKVLAEFAIVWASELGDILLDEAAQAVLEQGTPPITEITRRDIAKAFGHDLAGDRPLVEMIERHFVISSPLDDFIGRSGNSLRDQIIRHMVHHETDWTVEFLFEQIGALRCSRARFSALIEETVHPLARRGDDQVAMIERLNKLLARDQYHLVVNGEESGHPIYELQPIRRGVDGQAKNLIFASRGPKPELGFADAINNDIVILKGQESCLIYDRQLAAGGLLWSELVDWWQGNRECDSAEPAKSLGARLHQSLDSEGERNLFTTYFKSFRDRMGPALPALIPQVYLHYDPATMKQLRDRLPSNRLLLPRQRMDFLMLLPQRQRIVIEVDGSQHFSKDEKPSLALYSDMVSADRDLRLTGYEVFRFGSNELVGNNYAQRLTVFFERLFRFHGIDPGPPV
ncbi:hypothetical protein M8037_13205 [Sinorhizobium meliloti]|uniref:AbiJ-related protein n=1 Tax=Rhizobium meliloti TaxID=382 RepID=UPI002072E86B|nr:hypothetical protein [Sinorhizobium meliloti]MCM5689747.1 hypothetical protein [Sinorhizobium meliloti]